MIRVLIVDDSITQREILKRLLNADDGFRVVGEARNGKEAIEQVNACNPDVVLMDIHMPDMDGIEATRQIMQDSPVSIVVVSSTLRKKEIDLALKALEAGAITVMSKPKGAVLLHLEKIGPELRNELIAASHVKFPTRTRSRRESKPSPSLTEEPFISLEIDSREIDLVAICASTGGPPVLMEILSSLPKPFPIPILLVQHISSGFEEGFARWLSETTGHPTAILQNHQRLKPGVWMAPAGKHLTINGQNSLALVPAEPQDIHAPSGNPLFSSLAKDFGSRACGILLTGMGNDGAQGLLTLKQAGGATIIQNQATSAIWGMPKAASELNAEICQLTPAEIAAVLTRMAEDKVKP